MDEPVEKAFTSNPWALLPKVVVVVVVLVWLNVVEVFPNIALVSTVCAEPKKFWFPIIESVLTAFTCIDWVNPEAKLFVAPPNWTPSPPAWLVAFKTSKDEPIWVFNPPALVEVVISPNIAPLLCKPSPPLNWESIPISLVTVWYSPNSFVAFGIASTDGVNLDSTPLTFVVVLYSPKLTPSPWEKDCVPFM